MNSRIISGVSGLFLFVLCVLLAGNERCTAIFTASVIHECAHIAAARAVGAPLRFAGASPAGISLRFDFSGVSPFEEMFVCLAGPLSGVAVFLISYFSGHAALLGGACIVLALFNLLPASYLDGGCALYAALSLFLFPDSVWKITRAVSLICTLVIWMCAVVLVIRTDGEVSAIIVSLYLIIRSSN